MSGFQVESALTSAESASTRNANSSDVAYYRKASQATLERAANENQISIPCSLQIAEKLCKKIFTIYHPFRQNKAPLASAVWKQECQQYFRRITGEKTMNEQTARAKYDPEKLKAEFKALKIKTVVASKELGFQPNMMYLILSGRYSKNIVTPKVQQLIDYIQKKKLDGGMNEIKPGDGVVVNKHDNQVARREVGHELPASPPVGTIASIADQINTELQRLPIIGHLTILNVLVKLHNPKLNIEER